MNLKYIKYISCSGIDPDCDVDITYIEEPSAGIQDRTPIYDLKGLGAILAGRSWYDYIEAHGKSLSIPLAEYACRKLTRNEIRYAKCRDYCLDKRILPEFAGDLMYKVNQFYGMYYSLIGDESKIWEMARMAIGYNAPCDDAILVEAVHALADTAPDFDIKNFV